MEFEAVDEGTIAQILVAEGTDNVKVGTVIAVIAGEDEDASEAKAAPAPAPAAAAPAPTPQPARAEPVEAPSSPPTETKKDRSEEHTSELQSLMRISYAVFCLKKKKPSKNKEQKTTMHTLT